MNQTGLVLDFTPIYTYYVSKTSLKEMQRIQKKIHLKKGHNLNFDNEKIQFLHFILQYIQNVKIDTYNMVQMFILGLTKLNVQRHQMLRS